MGLSPDPLRAEIEPSRYSVRVSFSLQLDFVRVGCDHFGIFEISALEIALECNCPDLNDSA